MPVTNPLTGTYDIKDVAVAINGIPLDGWADGDAVTIVHQSPTWASRAGSGGEVARAKNNDRRATITFNLLATSMVNTILDAYRIADEATGRGCFSLAIVDARSGSSLVSPQAWITKRPDRTYGAEVPVISWEIEAGSTLEANIGTIPTPLG